MDDSRTFTPAEAAYVLGKPVKAVRKALDQGPIEPKRVRKGRRGSVRTMDRVDLLYLMLVQSLAQDLTAKARNDVYEALKSVSWDDAHEIQLGRVRISIDDLKAQVDERSGELLDLADKVEVREDGEAVLAGTDIEVHRIAALLQPEGELTVEQVCEDYPSLKPEQVETARAFAAAYPKPGRPYPTTTVKRAMKGAGLEALDEVLDDWKE